MSGLLAKRCLACEGGAQPLTLEEKTALLKDINSAWVANDSHTELTREFKFKNYYETMAFVNAITWMTHHENHHPDLEVGYNRCLVKYSTHAMKDLSENDFICAAKIDQILLFGF